MQSRTQPKQAAEAKAPAPVAARPELQGAGGAGPRDAFAGYLKGLAGGGRPLSAGVRAQMERGFGQDFSSIRVHEDADGARARGRGRRRRGPRALRSFGGRGRRRRARAG